MPFRLRFAPAALSLLAAGVAPALAQPANDPCTAPQVIPLGVPASGTTVGAGEDMEVSCQDDTADVWYRFTPKTFGGYVFSVAGEDNFALSLALISGCEFPIGEYACAGGAQDGPRIEQLLVPGDTLLIRVGSGVGQSFTLRADAAPPPANDECSGAVPLDLGLPIDSSNLSATTTLELNNGPLCASINPGVGGGADVFFSFTPPQDGYYDFSTCGAQLDSVVSIHSACPVSAANAIACNDNAALNRCGDPFDSYSSYVAGVQLSAGATYYVRVAGVRFVNEGVLGEPGRGAFSIAVLNGQPPVVPANDNCASAEVLLADNVINGSTINSTTSVPGVCGFDDVFDVWYSFTSTAFERQAFLFHVAPGAFNASASLTAYDACNGAVIACYASNPFVSPEMILWVVLDPSQTVKLRIAGHNAAQDEFTLITSTGPVAAPNTTCATALSISAGQTVTADTGGAATGDPTECGFDDINPLWYSFTAPTTGYYRFATDFPVDPESFDRTTIAVYSACGTSPLACSNQGDSFSENPNAGALALRLNAGQTRVFRVSYQTPRRAPMQVSVSGPLPPPPPVANDTCASAQNITSMPFTADVDVTVATPDQDVCAFQGEPAVPTPGGVWYRFTPEVNRFFRAEVRTNGAFAARATVFTGACGALTQVACPDPQSPPAAGLLMTAGTTYHILVSLDPGRDGPVGEIPYGTIINVNFIAVPRPTNDECATAQRIASSNASISISTLSADADAPEPSCVGFDGVLNNAVWYALSPTTSGTLTVHGEAVNFSFYSPGGALFSGSCAALTEVACDSPLEGFLITDHFDFTAQLQAGTTYYLMVGSWGAPSGGETLITTSYTGDLGCSADFNADGIVNSQDFFDFLTAFFAETPNADFNHDGIINSQDFFDFLTAFFEGCD